MTLFAVNPFINLQCADNGEEDPKIVSPPGISSPCQRRTKLRI